jgi:hypothetical protein
VSIGLAVHLATIQQRPTLIRFHLKSHDKNNKEIRYCRIGNCRFWAPCTLRHPPTNVDDTGRDSRFCHRKQTRVDFDRLALSRYRNRSNASLASRARRSQSTASRRVGDEHVTVSVHCLWRPSVSNEPPIRVRWFRTNAPGAQVSRRASPRRAAIWYRRDASDGIRPRVADRSSSGGVRRPLSAARLSQAVITRRAGPPRNPPDA